MAQKEDGGQAFPQPHQRAEACDGMTLRDYFATAAMQGLLAGQEVTAMDTFQLNNLDLLADAAYAAADAMITKRK